MLVTVEEARKKWCFQNEFNPCLADECMAWRLEEEESYHRYMREETRKRPDWKEWTGQQIADALTPRGYCGLAGKPE